MKTKYEQLIEFIINEDEDKARALFHEIVVEKSREIYESLIDEEDLEEAMGGDDVEEMVDEITDEEDEMHEEEEVDADEAGDDDSEESAMDMDMDAGDDDASDDGDAATKSDIMDIKDELEAIADKFDQLMGMDSDEEDMSADMGDDMAGDDMGMDMGDEGSEEMPEESLYMEGKGERRLTEAEWLREYMEKVGHDWESTTAGNEGHEVGAGKSAKVNTKSTVAGKNDMGGKAPKMGSHTEPGGDSTPSADPKGLLTKGGDMKTKGEFTNKVGGMKKSTNQMKPQHGENKPAAGDSILGK
jgi:hypothetical protein